MDWALVVAGLALVFSAYSFFRQFGLQRRVAEIEVARRAEEVASKLQADVTVEFKHSETRLHRGYELVLENRGPARAEGVTFELVGPDDERGSRALPELVMTDHAFPIPLDAGQTYEIWAVVNAGTVRSVGVVLRWTDGDGPQEKPLKLTVA